MQEVLDIYIKLLVAIISFIAPLIINLLSIFGDGIAIKKRRFKEFDEQASNLLKDEINSEGADIKKLIQENSKTFKKVTEDNNKQLDLLDPKKQIKNIFPTFFYSLLCIMANRLILDKLIVNLLPTNWIKDCLVIGAVVGSIYFAIKGVITLKKVMWAIIDIKQEIAQENDKLQSKSDAVTSSE